MAAQADPEGAATGGGTEGGGETGQQPSACRSSGAHCLGHVCAVAAPPGNITSTAPSAARGMRAYMRRE